MLLILIHYARGITHGDGYFELAVGEGLRKSHSSGHLDPTQIKTTVVQSIKCRRNEGNYKPCKSHSQKSFDAVPQWVSIELVLNMVYHMQGFTIPCCPFLGA